MFDRRTFVIGLLGEAGAGLAGRKSPAVAGDEWRHDPRSRPASARGEQERPRFDWTAFGADPTLDDNRPAIQACIDTAAAAGGRVHGPPGEYRIAGTLVIQGEAPVVLAGAGGATVLRQTRDLPTVRLKAGAHGVRDLSFMADDCVDRSIAVVVEPDAYFARVEGCRFLRVPSAAVLLQAGLRGAIVADNRCEECGHGREVVSPFHSAIRGADLTDCWIVGNHLYGGPQKGIDVGQDRSGNSNVRIVNNTVREFPGNIGIGVGSAEDTLIAHNYVTGCGDNAIDVNDLAGLGNVGTMIRGNTCLASKDGVFLGHGAREAAIVGNVIRGCQRGIRLLDGPAQVLVQANIISGTTKDHGIEVSSLGWENRIPVGLRLHDNVITRTEAHAIYVEDVRDLSVRAASFESIGGNAVRVDAGRGVKVEDCSFSDRSDGPDVEDHVRIESGCSSYLIRGNTFASPRARISADGPGGVVELNRWSGAAGEERSATDETYVRTLLNYGLDSAPPEYSVGGAQALGTVGDAATPSLAQVLSTLIADLKSAGIIR